ncbi:MAG: glucose-6-phosphate isomerase [Solirubrobacterales bacterium]|nr:glucose-6-phosphate isomerase [Solirubrobacterales bacterium]
MREKPPAVQALIPSQLAAAVTERLGLASEQRLAARLREGDASLWGPEGTPEIANRLGWLTIAERMQDELGAIEQLAREVREEGFQHVVLLGMGGSSLAPEVLRRTFAQRVGYPQLHVLDSTDAARVRSVGGAVDLERTLFIVSSKSGGTIEPLSLFAHFHALVEDGRQFLAITDPGSGLAELAAQHGFRATFWGNPDIGGRYSALSAFGIVPAALIGIDVRRLLAGAAEAWQTSLAASTAHEAGAETAGVWLGAALSALALAGRDKLTFLIAETLPGLGLWLEQLVAESTGKHATGILPVAEEPVGEPGEYGADRVFAYLPDLGAPDPALEERAQALAAAGHPLITIATHGPEDLGRVFMLAELAVAVAGWGLSINPFDQPNVQQAKDATKRVLADYEAQHSLPQAPSAGEASVRALLDGSPPEYLAIMAYLEPSPELDRAAGELRKVVRARTKLTSTFGYGPRFLHSTGQFHKGGPPTGRFLQLLHDAPSDVEIPGAAYSFTTLKNAQAIGDLDTLRELGRPAERVRLEGEDPVSALRALTAMIKEPT